MHIFTCYPLAPTIILSEEDSRHLARSLRKQIGDIITVISTAEQKFAKGTIISINKKHITVSLQNNPDIYQNNFSNSIPSQNPKINLQQAVIKKNKMELILQKATELGVAEITPLITEHIVPDAKKINLERFSKICKEAAMQCKRFTVPKICEPIHLKKTVFPENKNIFCLAEKKSSITLKDYLATIYSDKKDSRFPIPNSPNYFAKSDKITIIIGPEGGFSLNELCYLKEQNIPLVSFGDTILRAETAAISALSVLRYFFLT